MKSEKRVGANEILHALPLLAEFGYVGSTCKRRNVLVSDWLAEGVSLTSGLNKLLSCWSGYLGAGES